MRAGAAREMGLGPFPDITLADARERARKARRLLLDGIDPIEARRAQRASSALEGARALTFEQAAARYVAAHEAGWRSAIYRRSWRNMLANHAYPVMGAVGVAGIDTAIVLKVLEPIWTTKPRVASQLRGQLEAVLDWCKARGYREGDNPAAWRGHLAKLLPSPHKVRRVRHHPAMPLAELPRFVAELRLREGVSARALEFAILTAARSGEVLGACWPEIDLTSKLWAVPAERMKGGRAHRVPLADRALELLAALPREGAGRGFIFFGGNAHRPLNKMALSNALKIVAGDGCTVHGFRSTFRDWAAERTSFPRDVVEAALAHQVESASEAAYFRSDLFEKRRRLMADWAKYCSKLPAEDAKVVEIRRGRS
jgi:integrase